MIACALFTPFALWHAERLGPDLKAKPLVTLKKNKAVEVSSLAHEAGVESGMSLDGARSRCDDLVVVETNDATLHHAWEEVLGQLYAFTDRIEGGEPGVVFLELGEVDASLIAEQFQARVALAETQEHAHLKALTAVTEKLLGRGRGSSAGRGGDVKELPIAVLKELGLGKKSLEHLHWLGVDTVGELQRWSKTQLASFFGKEAGLLTRYLKGPYRRSVNRYTPPVTLEAAYPFEDTVTEPWQLDPMLVYLVSSLNDQLEDKVAARLTLTATSHGLAFSATRVSKEPLQGERLLLGQTYLALADCGVQGLGVDAMKLELAGLYRPNVQGTLFQSKAEVQKAVTAVEARFPGALLRFETLNPYSPVAEFSHRLVAVGRTESEVKREPLPRGRSARPSPLPRERLPSLTAR